MIDSLRRCEFEIYMSWNSDRSMLTFRDGDILTNELLQGFVGTGPTICHFGLLLHDLRTLHPISHLLFSC